MQTLLPAIQTVLQTGLTQLNRQSDCYVTPNVNIMPTGTRQPCIGITDGGVTRVELAGEMLELTMRVDLAGFVRLPNSDGYEAICGEGGVFQLLDDATALLIANPMTAISGMDPKVLVGDDRASEAYQAENRQWLVKLVRTVFYTCERSSV